MGQVIKYHEQRSKEVRKLLKEIVNKIEEEEIKKVKSASKESKTPSNSK